MSAVHGLTAGGWVFLLCVWISMIAVTGYCFYKVIRMGSSA